MERLTWDDIEALADANWHRRDAQGTMLNKVRAQFHAYTVELADAQATVEALQRERIFKEYVRLFRLCEPIAKMLSELSILPIGCSREQELAWKMAVKNFRHYQRDYAADVLLQAALTPAGGGQDE